MKDSYINLFSEIKKENGKFSITVDEWTDNRLKRYINVTARSYTLKDSFQTWVLGLVEIEKRADAENIKIYVKDLLVESFCLDFDNDIIASTHDGASVMVKYGNNINCASQLCHNHGVHLAVLDTLYKRDILPKENEIIEESSSEEDNFNYEEEITFDSFNQNFAEQSGDYVIEVIEEDLNLELFNANDIINKVRATVNIFRKSPIKNIILQKYIKNKEGKHRKLLADIRIRWNSLVVMLRRFVRVVDCVNHALLEFKLKPYEESEIKTIQNMLYVLMPVEVAILELSKENSTLITSEGVYKFLFNSLKQINTDLSCE